MAPGRCLHLLSAALPRTVSWSLPLAYLAVSNASDHVWQLTPPPPPPPQVPMSDYEEMYDDVASSTPGHHDEHEGGVLDTLMSAAAAALSFIGTGQTHPAQQPHDTDLPAGGTHADSIAHSEAALPSWLSVDRLEAADRTALHELDTAAAHAHSSVTHANMNGSRFGLQRQEPLTEADLDRLRELRHRQRVGRLQLLVPMVEEAGPPEPLDFTRCAEPAR